MWVSSFNKGFVMSLNKIIEDVINTMFEDK
jgi:hypothetical protein